MGNSLTIAVIINCYNYEKYIGRAIRSVLTQQSQPDEFIVVDDGSTDESWNIIRKTKVDSFRIKNSGQRVACLYGLNKTSSHFILFLDADDELKPDAIKVIRNHLDINVAKAQYSLTCIDDCGKVIKTVHPALGTYRHKIEIVRQVLKTNVYQSPPTSGNVFRRDVCEILNESSYENMVDGIILFAAPFLGDIVSISEPLAYYRMHGLNDSGLGRGLDSAVLKRDLTRFINRFPHLLKIASKYNLNAKLKPAEETYYFYSLSFFICICESKNFPVARLFKMIFLLFWEPGSLKSKCANSAFIVFLHLAPSKNAKALLNVRHRVVDRTYRHFIRAAFVGR